jgi:NAD(P)-dependent dehydrogenase (short-subunit alcohol dehydrogenase family)
VTWTTDEVPDLSGKTFVVTGANSGIGLEAARIFIDKGGEVILACRSAERARPAVTMLAAERQGAKVSFLVLDLADLASVKRFSDQLHQTVDHIDVLVNNAGVMALPRNETADGFELQLGTNHLGHFALTGRLLDLLQAAPAPRVVTVSSHAHRNGTLRFDDLMSEKSYDRWGAYCQSKLANLLFHFELSKRSRLLCAACHPGYTATNLQAANARMTGSTTGEFFWSVVNRWVAQGASPGSHPTVYAATMSDVKTGDYYGPMGLMEMWGPPVRVEPRPRALDEEAAARLWTISTELTGVDYSFS